MTYIFSNIYITLPRVNIREPIFIFWKKNTLKEAIHMTWNFVHSPYILLLRTYIVIVIGEKYKDIYIQL